MMEIARKFLMITWLLIQTTGSEPIDPADQNVDLCYTSDGSARKCLPEFVNAALGRTVEVTSTCGSPPTKHCVLRGSSDSSSEQRRDPKQVLYRRHRQQPSSKHPRHLEHQNRVSCFVCDASNPSSSYPTQHLTDLHNSNNVTCWVSSPFQRELNQETDSSNSSHVTLTLNLEKKFEITYISLQFCSMRPDSLAIYKSADHGRSWLPFQFYSSDCKKTFDKQAKSQASKANEQEALCSEIYSQQNHLTGSEHARVAFSTLEGRPSASEIDSNLILQDWQTATDIRIVLKKHQQSPFLHSDLIVKRSSSRNSPRIFRSSDFYRQESNSNSLEFQQGSSLLGTFQFFSMSDIAIGGRCKCNGHASECTLNRHGKPACRCRHNTEGVDCDRCKPFYVDRPWNRATQQEANECIACNCNGHSTKCRFNMELYKQSKSGGVCVSCRHNTEGKHCHLCKKNFFRDTSKPITHRKACKECTCHPVGSLDRSCDQLTGQCPCRPGVVGLTCSRCAPGYQQSRSTVEPCIKIQHLATIPAKEYDKSLKSVKKCDNCLKRTPFRSIGKICKNEFVAALEVTSQEQMKDWIKYRIRLKHFFKRPQSLRWKTSKSSEEILWMVSDENCQCPKLKTGRSYLVVGKKDPLAGSTAGGMVLSGGSTFTKWTPAVSKKMEQLLKSTGNNRC